MNYRINELKSSDAILKYLVELNHGINQRSPIPVREIVSEIFFDWLLDKNNDCLSKKHRQDIKSTWNYVNDLLTLAEKAYELLPEPEKSENDGLEFGQYNFERGINALRPMSKTLQDM